jgi:hypothetical protein
VRDAHGVACFEKFERRLAVDAEDGVFNFSVGGGIDATTEKLITGVDVFDFAGGGGTEDIFEHDGVAGLGDREIGFSGDDHAESLHIGDGFHFAAAIFENDFAKINSTAAWRDGPEDVGEIFEAELGGFVETSKFCFDFGAIAFVLDFGFAAGLLHQFSTLKIDFGGAGATVVHGFGGTRNTLCRGVSGGGRLRWGSGRGCLREGGRCENADRSSECEKRGCDFHVKPPVAGIGELSYGREMIAVRSKRASAHEARKRENALQRQMSLYVYSVAKKES